MKLVAVLLLALTAFAARAERILLIPLDSRPAAGQFAQMIAKTANVNVVMPPYETLGRFTTPGNCEAILDWLEKQDLSDVSAVVASADMIEYGGLIASRTNNVTVDLALKRIRRLSKIVRMAPKTKLYVFSSTMRLTPTATRSASKFRILLARYEECKAKYAMTRDDASKKVMDRLFPKIPKREIDIYENTRRRSNAVQQILIRMQKNGAFDYLVIGQDDARPFGPHVAETIALKKLVQQINIGKSVFFCEGVDQHASVLVSRALLTENNFFPKVRVVYSDEDGKLKYANFESKHIEESLNDQLLASGAVPAGPNDTYDYTLYLNTPGRSPARFEQFLAALKNDVDQGFPTAVADIDLASDGTADPELFKGLWENTRMMRLLSYAGWNTAGNTMGTSIPAANVYLMARRSSNNALIREVAQREFLLHRFTNDFAYHKFTRPAAYKMIRESGVGTTEEVYGDELEQVQSFVREDLAKHLDFYFKDQFLDRKFFVGTEEYTFTDLTDVKIWLPWPRAYEVRLEFKLKAKPVEINKAASR